MEIICKIIIFFYYLSFIKCVKENLYENINKSKNCLNNNILTVTRKLLTNSHILNDIIELYNPYGTLAYIKC